MRHWLFYFKADLDEKCRTTNDGPEHLAALLEIVPARLDDPERAVRQLLRQCSFAKRADKSLLLGITVFKSNNTTAARWNFDPA